MVDSRHENAVSIDVLVAGEFPGDGLASVAESSGARWRPKNPALAEGALHRALELFDLTFDDPRLRQSPARLREVARAREVVADFFAGPNQYRSTAASLQKHFDAYAMAGR